MIIVLTVMEEITALIPAKTVIINKMIGSSDDYDDGYANNFDHDNNGNDNDDKNNKSNIYKIVDIIISQQQQ